MEKDGEGGNTVGGAVPLSARSVGNKRSGVQPVVCVGFADVGGIPFEVSQYSGLGSQTADEDEDED